jgi:transposase
MPQYCVCFARSSRNGPHILVDANGVPISAILTGANFSDVTQLLPLVDAITPIRGVRGRPLQKPQVIYADCGYDSEPHRQKLRKRGIKPVIAQRRSEHDSGLGKFRGRAYSRMAPQLSSSHSL